LEFRGCTPEITPEPAPNSNQVKRLDRITPNRSDGSLSASQAHVGRSAAVADQINDVSKRDKAEWKECGKGVQVLGMQHDQGCLRLRSSQCAGMAELSTQE
jgi:hypothetical protein